MKGKTMFQYPAGVKTLTDKLRALKRVWQLLIEEHQAERAKLRPPSENLRPDELKRFRAYQEKHDQRQMAVAEEMHRIEQLLEADTTLDAELRELPILKR